MITVIALKSGNVVTLPYELDDTLTPLGVDTATGDLIVADHGQMCHLDPWGHALPGTVTTPPDDAAIGIVRA